MRLLNASTLAFLAPPVLASTPYQIYPVHSEVSFRVRHLGLSKVYGRFTSFKGVTVLDGKDLAKSKVDVTIEVTGGFTMHGATRRITIPATGNRGRDGFHHPRNRSGQGGRQAVNLFSTS